MTAEERQPETPVEDDAPPATDVEGDPTRTSILRVTYRLLEDLGYAAVTTDTIAAEARVSKATIYRHWRSKQELVVDAARMHFGRVEAPELGSFSAEIHWILEHRVQDYRQPGTLRLVGSLVGAATTDPQLQEVFAEWVEQLTRAVRRVIQRGIARGDVRSDVDIFALETMVAGVVARTVIAQQSFSGTTVDSIVGLLAAAVRPASG
jgi:AcrR family transcriptional regulator